ncbi:PTS ascorbate transporter subunit IIC [Enterococcus faecalis]|uniref:PTS ascorbate transporter subunit IIC n=1 Tax=Enterococcus faecalis TaxID=1351 RepID=UPI002456EC7F|nr:PTS ascorbate transporter subunit IIC [Enterococcus faecalis]MDH5045327.1 PTS ascorbate transporter subunit IIC [Enterococcus faecalis]
MKTVIDFLIFQLLDKPPIFLGIISLIGLLLQGKKFNDVIDGVVKTVVGITILSIGSSMLTSTLGPVMAQLNTRLGVKGVLPANEAAFGVAMDSLSSKIVITFLIGFFLHLLLVKFTPGNRFKNVYLTVHIMLFLATFLTVSLPQVLGTSSNMTVAISAILCAFYWTYTPAIPRVLSKKWTGDVLTLGHHQQIGAWLASKLGKLVGDPNDDAENIKLPKSISVFRDNTISLAFLMPLIFIGIGLAIGEQGISELAGTSNWLTWLFLQGISFTAGIVILLSGVRMFISSIVPAFKGISDKFLPGSIPALDCPVFFPYSPMGSMLGFLASVAGALLVMILTIFLSPIIVFPSPIIMFFDGSTMGVFGNKYGGWKGALVAGFTTSIIAHLGVVLLYPLTGSLYGSGLTFSNIDFSLFWLPLMYVLKLIGSLLGLA